MKRVNTKVSKRIVAVVLAAVAAITVVGCTVAKKNEVKKDTRVITMETKASDLVENVTVKTIRKNDPEVFKKVPIDIANDMGWDVAGIFLKMSSQDVWSDNFLGDDMWLDNGQTMSGINVTYDSDDRYIDLYVVDSTGEGVEFDNVKLPIDGAKNITVTLERDAENEYHVYVD